MMTLMDSPTRSYRMLGGGTIKGETPEQLVAALRASSREPLATVEEFMEETSRACRTYSGAIISTYNAEEFVADLIENEFLVDADKPPGNVVPFKPLRKALVTSRSDKPPGNVVPFKPQ